MYLYYNFNKLLNYKIITTALFFSNKIYESHSITCYIVGFITFTLGGKVFFFFRRYFNLQVHLKK